MSETNYRSLRIVVDLQACQTAASARRGVGRYTKSLFLAMAAASGARDIFGLVAAQLDAPVGLEDFSASRLICTPALPDWATARDFEGGDQDSLDGIVQTAAAATVYPDVVHVSHIFEGFAERVALPCARNRPIGQVLSATLFDLIPLRFDHHYFRDARFEKWYWQRAQWLRQADVLLAISEATRKDAIDLLDLDPSRIVTIHGGVSAHFRPASDVFACRARLAASYGIVRSRFVLYTGGDDHRKNLLGAIEAYALLPTGDRQDCHFVIVCHVEADRKRILLEHARKAGLSAGDLLVLGFVPEDDLVALYSTCELFFFPSLYEGLGLPIIEAMSCGAPVIGGNNSSIREIVDQDEVLFDAAEPSAAANVMHCVLNSTDLRNSLRQHNLDRAQQFTWRNSARLALEALDDAARRKRETGVLCACNGWLPRPRIAILTPLPPCRSGIADYNASFLPYLAEHFDIDLFVDGYRVANKVLNAAFRIFDASDFPRNAGAYEAIVYEMGNSEFHAHMLPLLARYPGIVGLHDAFLSGLMGYLQFNVGEEDRYVREMLSAHGGQARRLFAPVKAHPNPISASMVDLPCVKSVLDQAIGIISHSPFNLETARKFHPEGWRAPFRIIPQMVALPEIWSAPRTEAARTALGFAPDDFIVTTFGHATWTKCGDRLLEAFCASLAQDRRCHLIFAGELAKDDFGLALNNRIRKLALGGRIRITGFLPDEDYERYLRVSDLAVQLRTNSRGGTPKSVLDCLAHCVPVVVNNDASFVDYPDDVVAKLGANPGADEIATCLMTLYSQASVRQSFRERGLAYVREHHDPKLCAAKYASAICEFRSRAAALEVKTYARDMAPHIMSSRDPRQAATSATSYLESLPSPAFRKPRLLIDVSHIAAHDHRTGIQRVVKEIVGSASCSSRADIETVAVQLVENQLVPAKAWLERQNLLLPCELKDKNEALSFRRGDHLLMLDSSWERYAAFAPVFAQAREHHVPITTAVYDLLPITLPPGNFVDQGSEWFEAWLRRAIAESDRFVCISRATAIDLIDYIRRHNLGRPGHRVGYWHLGANLPDLSECSASSSVRASSAPYMLMVGTIEPRKNHALALDAFERMWRQSLDLKLVIVGKPGWLVDTFVDRIKSHPSLNRQLFHFDNSSDPEIDYLYRHASALLLPSKGEGFGLPLVEAARHGIPLVCSDIPVFREIAGEHATYVNIADAETLARELVDWWGRWEKQQVPQSSNMRCLSWDESAELLIDVLTSRDWYWTGTEGQEHN